MRRVFSRGTRHPPDAWHGSCQSSRAESSYECVTCAVGLCVDPCFKLYHTNKDFISAYKRHVIRKEGAENGELEEN